MYKRVSHKVQGSVKGFVCTILTLEPGYVNAWGIITCLSLFFCIS